MLGKSGPCSRAYRVDGGHVTDAGPEFRRRYDAGCGERQQAHALYGRVPLSNAGWCFGAGALGIWRAAPVGCVSPGEARNGYPAGRSESCWRYGFQNCDLQFNRDRSSGIRGPPRPPDLSMRSDKIQALLSFCLPGLRQWLSDGSSVGADPGTIPSRISIDQWGACEYRPARAEYRGPRAGLPRRHVRFSFVDSGEQRAI